jgi:hypothetical protein
MKILALMSQLTHNRSYESTFLAMLEPVDSA